MLPPFDRYGNLPPGIHLASWDELVARFGITSQRLLLLGGLRLAAVALKRAGCNILYVDGSFVTRKAKPADFDGCWDRRGVDGTLLDPVLLTLYDDGKAQKAKYGGELYPVAMREVGRYFTYLEFFQRDRKGHLKGIVALDLKELNDDQG